MRRGLSICALSLLALATGSARAEPQAPQGELVEVVVSLSQKPLATTSWRAGRQLQTRTLANAQASLAQRIETAVPDARIRWRYRLVANGMAVVVPRSQLGRLTSLPGVETVYPSVRYRPQLDRSPQQIGAPALWGPGLTNAGQGIKIAIIDEGIDQTHPFFSPAGYTMPAGLPQGPDRVHDGEGDRRARVPAREPDVEARRRSRSTPSCRPTARTSRASPPATRTRSPRASASPASRRARISATTRR